MAGSTGARCSLVVGKKASYWKISGSVIDIQNQSKTHVHSSGGGGFVANGSGFVAPPVVSSSTSTTTAIS